MLKSFLTSLLNFAVGFAVGWMIWRVSPIVSWDVNPSDTWPVMGSLFFFGGLVASLLQPKTYSWGLIGIYFGELVVLRWFTSFPERPPEYWMHFVSVPIFGLPLVAAGGLVGAAVGKFVARTLTDFRDAAFPSPTPPPEGGQAHESLQPNDLHPDR